MGLDTDRHARSLLEQGFAVFDDLYDDAEVRAFRQALEELYRAFGSPACWADPMQDLGACAQVSKTGFAVAKLLEHRPELASCLLKAPVVDAVRRTLGDDMHLELTATIIADPTRRFFEWHNHVGGVDDQAYRVSGQWPVVEHQRRIAALLYLDDLTDDNGPLLVYPRAVGTPTAPPHEFAAQDWTGQVVIHARRGSVVAIDECTWHAARPKTTPGLRMLIGCNFAARTAPPSPLVEHSLRRLTAAGDLLASVLPPEVS